jgi:hypothetical protein
VKYLFDNCISPKLADMLRALGEDTRALREDFSESIEDTPLFKELIGQNLVFVSTDTKQRTREHEARALKEAGITAIYFGPFFMKMKLWPQATWLIARWEKIKGVAENVVMGSVFEIKQNGSACFYRL